jgi:hypothetical protein
MTQARTIQIFLPDGNARSIRIADITSRTVQAIQIPRNKLKDANIRDEVKNVGIYFLFGEESEEAKPLAYIGEAENCYDRLNQHNKDIRKDFWRTAVVFISKTSSFTKAHGKYLEWYCLTTAREVDRYKIEQTMPSKPYVSESMEADLLDNLDAIRILLSTLGFPLLETIQKPKSRKDVLHCKRKQNYAEGEYIDDGFVVYKGSKASITESPGASHWIGTMRSKLKDSGVLKQEGNFLVFQSDYVFDSPSAAAGAVFGSHANGWTEWKNNDGKSLDELKRK